MVVFKDNSAVIKFRLNKYFFQDMNKPECFETKMLNLMEGANSHHEFAIQLLSKCDSASSIYNYLLDPNDEYHRIKHNASNNLVFDTEYVKPVEWPQGEYNQPQILLDYNDYADNYSTTGFIINAKQDLFTLNLPSTGLSIKAFVLYNLNTSYMMAYCVLPSAVTFHNQIHIPMDGGLTSVTEQVTA